MRKMIPFKIVRPFTWRNKTWMQGQESSLRMQGWGVAEFAKAIETKDIEPAIDGQVWYDGPWKLILRDQELYTISAVRSAVVAGRKIRNISTHRTDQILEYLNSQPE